MRTICALAGVAMLAGCTHVPRGARPGGPAGPPKAQTLELTGCKPMAALRDFEAGLMKNGFTREAEGDEPAPFALLDAHLSRQHRFLRYEKVDFEEARVGAPVPYREIPNEYRVSACEEPGGNLYLIVVRRQYDEKDSFLGARFRAALDAACAWRMLSAPRPLPANLQDEESLLQRIRSGRCRD